MDPCFQIPLNPESFPPYYWTRLRKPGDIKGSQFPRFASGGCKKIQLSPVDSSIGGLTTGKLDKHLQQIQSWETHYHNGFMIIERPFSHTPRCPWGMDQQCLFQSDTPCCTSLVAGLRQDFFCYSPANCGHWKTREINGTLFPHCGHHETIICWMRVNTRQNTKVTKAQAFRKQEGHRDASCGNRPNLTSVKQPKCSTWKSKRQRSGIMNDESVDVWYVRNFGLPSGKLSHNYGNHHFSWENPLFLCFTRGYIPLTVPTTSHFSTPSRCQPWTEPLSATDQRNCEKRVPCGVASTWENLQVDWPVE